MTNSGVRVLYIEDNEGDAFLAKRVLAEKEIGCVWASDLQTARVLLSEEKFDLILLDQGLPDGNGLAFIEEILRMVEALPVIVLSGRKDQSLALAAIQKGARDFVLKDEVRTELAPAVRSALSPRAHPGAPLSRPAAEPLPSPFGDAGGASTDDPSKSARRFLGRAAALYRKLFVSMNEACLLFDEDGVVTFANRALERLLGWPGETHLGGYALSLIFGEQTARQLTARAFAGPADNAGFQMEGLFRTQDERGSIAVSISGQRLQWDDSPHSSGMVMIRPILKQEPGEAVDVQNIRSELSARSAHSVLEQLVDAAVSLERARRRLGENSGVDQARNQICGALVAALDLASMSSLEAVQDLRRAEKDNVGELVMQTCRRVFASARDFGVQVICHAPAERLTLPPEINFYWFRGLVFDLVCLAAHHAAGAVWVRPSEIDGQPRIVIDQDGARFEPELLAAALSRSFKKRPEPQLMGSETMPFWLLQGPPAVGEFKVTLSDRAAAGSRVTLLLPVHALRSA